MKIQRDVEQHAKELDARDPRNRVHAELMSYGTGGQYVALVVGRFGEFSKDFIKLRDYIARQKAYAYVEHFNSSIMGAMSMFKLSITSRWALMAARGWARLILDRRRDLVNDRPIRAAAAEAPLDGARLMYGSELVLPCYTRGAELLNPCNPRLSANGLSTSEGARA